MDLNDRNYFIEFNKDHTRMCIDKVHNKGRKIVLLTCEHVIFGLQRLYTNITFSPL